MLLDKKYLRSGLLMVRLVVVNIVAARAALHLRVRVRARNERVALVFLRAVLHGQVQEVVKTRRVGIYLVRSHALVLRVRRNDAFAIDVADFAVRIVLLRRVVQLLIIRVLFVISVGQVQSLDGWRLFEVDLTGYRILLEREWLATVEREGIRQLIPKNPNTTFTSHFL